MFYSKPWLDVLIVVFVLLLFFGPKRLPALGKSLGEGMREFKDSISGRSKDSDQEERPELEAGAARPTVQNQAQAQQTPEPATVSAPPQRSEPETGSTSSS